MAALAAAAAHPSTTTVGPPSSREGRLLNLPHELLLIVLNELLHGRAYEGILALARLLHCNRELWSLRREVRVLAERRLLPLARVCGLDGMIRDVDNNEGLAKRAEEDLLAPRASALEKVAVLTALTSLGSNSLIAEKTIQGFHLFGCADNIKRFATFSMLMRKHAKLEAHIEGHAATHGSAQIAVSRQRAAYIGHLLCAQGVDASRLHMRGWGNRISSAETWVGAHRAQVFFTFRSKNAHAIGPQVGPNGGPYLPHDDGQGVAVDNYAFMPPRSGSYAFYDTLAAALAHLSGVSRWVKKDNSFRRKVAREAARSKARQVQLHRML